MLLSFPQRHPRLSNPMVKVRLKTKLVLAISGMVFVLVALFCYIYISHRVRQSTQAAHDRAVFVAEEIEESAHFATAVDSHQLDIDLDDPQRIQTVIESRLQNDKGMSTLLQSIIAYSPSLYDAGIADVHGRVIVHNDPSAVGKLMDRRDNFDDVL